MENVGEPTKHAMNQGSRRIVSAMRRWATRTFWSLVIALLLAQFLGWAEAIVLQFVDFRRMGWSLSHEREALALSMSFYQISVVPLAVAIGILWPLLQKLLPKEWIFKSLGILLAVCHLGLVLTSKLSTLTQWRKLASLDSWRLAEGVAIFAGLIGFYCVCWVLAKTAWNTTTRLGRAVRTAAVLLAVTGLAWSSVLSLGRIGDPSYPALPQAQASELPPSVLLIVLDTFRTDMMSCYGGNSDVMPNLNRFTEQSTVFTRAISPSGWTLPAHASMFTGLFATQHGVDNANLNLDPEFATSAEILREHGYQTAGFNCNPFLMKLNGYAQGFDTWWIPFPQSERLQVRALKHYGAYNFARLTNIHFGYRTDWSIVGAIEPYPDKGARDLEEALRNWYARQFDPSRPFYVFLNYFETHFPLSPPTAFRREVVDLNRLKRSFEIGEGTEKRLRTFFATGHYDFTDEECEILNRLYEGEARYLDSRLGRTFRFLQDSNLLKNTLVIITADHGELLGEHRMMGHRHTIHQPVVHVPLVIHLPEEFPPGRQVTNLVQTSDLFWTTLALCGINLQPPDGLPARDLTDWKSAEAWPNTAVTEIGGAVNPVRSEGNFGAAAPESWRALWNQKAVYFDNWKYVRRPDGHEQLFDIHEDPGETTDLLPGQALVVDRLRSRLDAWVENADVVAKLVEPAKRSQPQPIPSSVSEQLRDLGYLQ
jgi:arylsulfatase A-like enzyme